MPVRASYEEGGESLVLRVPSYFDFSVHEAFRAAYEGAEGVRRFVVDLHETEYLDSSALGMLLLLNEFAIERGGEVVIRHCCHGASQILERTNFLRLFQVED
ncbi:STAS domain-containing protein [Halorhodospira halophila]|uniref:STAS domain-containing protein n=1 Tax=Halorhodospira halophila TaxID=1053 RepID=UPI00191352B8|nr:STAS domain-containing protein [Halorhodospira halophila]MBK5942678.1 anti-anti-sigma factor [Halorhodospira halophila]